MKKTTTLRKQGPRSFSFMFAPHTLESVPQGFYTFNCFYFVDAEILFTIMAYMVDVASIYVWNIIIKYIKGNTWTKLMSIVMHKDTCYVSAGLF